MQKRKLTGFGMKIKKRLLEMSMSQRELSEKLGVSEVYLSRIMHGDRGDKTGTKYESQIIEILKLNIKKVKGETA